MADLDPTLVAEAGLNLDRIRQHAQRVRGALTNSTATTIPVRDACTVENGHVVSWLSLDEWVSSAAAGRGESAFADARRHWQEKHLVTAIPAAGAASRFLGEFQKFVLDVEAKVPGLRELQAGFSARNATVTLSKAARESALAALEKVDVPEKFHGVPGAILEQDFPDVRVHWMRLTSYLLDLLESGELAGDTRSALLVENETPPVLVERSLAELRRPWNAVGGHEDYNFEHEAADHHEHACGGHHEHECSGHHHEPGHECCGGHDEEEMAEFEFNVVHFYAAAKAFVDLYGGVPKALVPTTDVGDTFLRLKLVEQISLVPCSGNVLIVPAGQVSAVRKVIDEEGKYLKASYQNPFELAGTPFSPAWLRGQRSDYGRWVVMEQGHDLSTIRFNMDGTPCLDQGNYSVVAAGHGELVHLFDGIAREFPQAECLHIRNIDNVVGASLERQSEMGTLSDAFRLIRDSVEFLRDACEKHVQTGARDSRIASLEVGIALEFLANLLPQTVAEEALRPCLDDQGEYRGVPVEALYDVLGTLFHWPKERPQGATALWTLVSDLLGRPLSVFGVVRKEDNDVGGGPVLVTTADGQEIKICLEMPHASGEDAKAYFGPGGKATHFNPVLTFFELRTHTRPFADGPETGRVCEFRRLFDDRFWMLSRKDFQGKPVCYHETVLYELIGNSATTNLIFVEVPRSLFNPHKTMFESLGRVRESYGFHETLGEPEVSGEGA